MITSIQLNLPIAVERGHTGNWVLIARDKVANVENDSQVINKSSHNEPKGGNGEAKS